MNCEFNHGLKPHDPRTELEVVLLNAPKLSKTDDLRQIKDGFRGKHLAIVENKVIDSDKDGEVLRERFLQKFDRKPDCFIFVTEDGELLVPTEAE